MKSTKILKEEKIKIFFKRLEKVMDGKYAVFNRINRQKASKLWDKYLTKRLEELDEQIEFNNNILSMVNEKN